jgi:arsenate reductase-like glutaredoxin family protein
LETLVMKDASEQKLVTLYVVPDCSLCAHARLWLQQHHIDYIELDVAGDFGALRSMYKLTRQRLVPVLGTPGRALVRPTDQELTDFLL